MILPTKYLLEHNSLLAAGAVLLKHLAQPMTTTHLWERLRSHRSIGSYDRFILALDLLFVLGTVWYVDGTIRRVNR